jgi:hypothetical protein
MAAETIMSGTTSTTTATGQRSAIHPLVCANHTLAPPRRNARTAPDSQFRKLTMIARSAASAAATTSHAMTSMSRRTAMRSATAVINARVAIATLGVSRENLVVASQTRG